MYAPGVLKPFPALGLPGIIALSLVLVPVAPPASAGRAPAGPPSNVACLPFPEREIVYFNGGGDAFDQLDDPYQNRTDQATITWKDVDDPDITAYRIDRRMNNGSWQMLVDDLPVDTRFYTDTMLDELATYDYRVRQVLGDTVGTASDTCRKPLYASAGEFTVFYRLQNCPQVDDADGTGHVTCVSDAATADFILADLVGSIDALTDLMFEDPLTESLPVDLFPCDGGGCARTDGTASSKMVALDPAFIEPVYDPDTLTGKQGSVDIPLHELFHKFEGHYGCCDNDPSGAWINEATARSVQDKVCVQSQNPCVTLDQAPGSGYYNEVLEYLADPNQTLTESSYNAALFWTYLTEQFGQEPTEPQRGMDFLLTFFQHLDADGKDGIDTVTAAMADHDADGGFKEAFEGFAIANAVKDLPNAPPVYSYLDEDQPPGSYGPVALTVDTPIDSNTQSVGVTDVAPWGVRYFKLTPDPALSTIDLVFDAELPDALAYHVLGIRDGGVALQVDSEGPDYSASFENDAFDQVIVVLTGLENGGIVHYAINGKDPAVEILDPIEGRAAQAGDPANPRKFLAKVRVLSPEDGSPVAGIDPAQEFTATVGGLPLDLTDPDVLIASAYVQGQYWMVLRAPVQPAEGTYDLQIDYGGFADTEADAVNYAVIPDNENVLVVDRSGSMGDFDKLDAAKDGGRLYVDAWNKGDQIGVVSFADGAATTDLALSPWSETVRQDAFDALDALVASGSTAIGAGLLQGLGDLDANGDPANPWSEVLLTDGLDNTPPLIDEFLDTYDARKLAHDPLPAVHAVGLGPNADLEKLEALAEATGGTFEYASQAPGAGRPVAAGAPLFSELAEIHRVVAEASASESEIYAATAVGPLPGGLATYPIRVDKGVREATFVVNWSPPNLPGLTVSLLRPNGTTVSPTLTDQTHTVFRVSKPASGTWLMLVGTAAGANGTYLVEASVRADVTLFGALGLPLDRRQAGRPMPILASLSERAGIPNASVAATVIDPGGASHAVTLKDDGAHGDGAAGDGLYGRTFVSTFEPGSYVVVIDANGTAPTAGQFTRRSRLAFTMSRPKDGDGDGLPTWWEKEHGTDPNRPDGNGDPDGDGCTNLQEYGQGTHPQDGDTDGGGEGDCSEHVGERDPLDPGDDAIHQPRARAWPGVGQAWVTFYSDSLNAQGVIERSTDPDGPFKEIAQVRGRVFQDRGLTEGKRYCYRVKASIGSTLRSGPSTVECVTPNVDPYAPQGGLLINGGKFVTGKRTVTLRIQASDVPASAESDDAFYRFLDPAATSTGVVEMKIWNRGHEKGAQWRPFATKVSWKLPSAEGLDAVMVRFRDAAGNESPAFLDSIVFRRA